jgi:hypothetical protein
MWNDDIHLDEAFRDALERQREARERREDEILQSKAFGTIRDGYIRCYDFVDCSFTEYLACINAMVRRQAKAHGERFAVEYRSALAEAGAVTEEDCNKVFWDVIQRTP